VYKQEEVTMLSIDKATLHKLYQMIVRIRLFEQRIMELFPQGRLPGFLHVSIGQEAVSTGVRAHLRRHFVLIGQCLVGVDAGPGERQLASTPSPAP
jgi:TPP-dependent pyruvate/acetoin dehydrogenase alpha subunit